MFSIFEIWHLPFNIIGFSIWLIQNLPRELKSDSILIAANAYREFATYFAGLLTLRGIVIAPKKLNPNNRKQFFIYHASAGEMQQFVGLICSTIALR